MPISIQGRPISFRRLEVLPREEAQVDFGAGAPILRADDAQRWPHALRVVLSFSRKAYSEVVYHQTTEDFLRCLENAFWNFGGVPQTLGEEYSILSFNLNANASQVTGVAGAPGMKAGNWNSLFGADPTV